MKIKIHYIKTKNSSAYIDANILHPEKKLRLFKKKDSSFTEISGQAEIYEKAARTRFDKLYNNSVSSKLMIESFNSLKRKRAVDSDDSDDFSNDNDQFDTYNEFDHYLRVKRDRNVKNALIW